MTEGFDQRWSILDEEDDESDQEAIDGEGFDEGERENHRCEDFAIGIGVTWDAFERTFTRETLTDTATASGDTDGEGSAEIFHTLSSFSGVFATISESSRREDEEENQGIKGEESNFFRKWTVFLHKRP